MNYRKSLLFCVLGLMLSAPLAWSQTATQPSSTTQSEKPDLLEVAARAKTFRKLLDAVDLADLSKTLKEDGPYTIFAPSDAAFKSLPKDHLQRLKKDKQMLRKFLLHHVVSGSHKLDAVMKADSLDSLNGEIDVRRLDGEDYLETARVISANHEARNGMIHVIDRVLMPPLDETWY